jgi:hypothetical protein
VVGGFEKYESQWKGFIPYMKWKIKVMYHQPGKNNKKQLSLSEKITQFGC